MYSIIFFTTNSTDPVHAEILFNTEELAQAYGDRVLRNNSAYDSYGVVEH